MTDLSALSLPVTPEPGVGARSPLLTTYRRESLVLPNRIVMAPMTRGRTESRERIPSSMEATYFAQRAGAGLIVTGGTYVSPQAVGGIRVPGVYSDEQVEGWRHVVDRVHTRGGRIFLQLAHSGSISHPDLLDGALPVAPSAVNPLQKTFTPAGFKDTIVPRALERSDIAAIIDDFGRAARNARLAGFDGVELHAANVYLLPQFLSSAVNQRDDDYGGSPGNRSRIVLEVLDALAAHWPRQQIGIKLSPGLHGVGVMVANEDTLPTYDYLVDQLDRLDLAYLHLMRPMMDVSATAIAMLQGDTYRHFRTRYRGTLIANGGFDVDTASALIASGEADLVSFARHFIANPDLPERIASGSRLASGDMGTYYQGGEQGYTTYPVMAA